VAVFYVAWVMWKKTVLTQHPEWRENPSEADYSGIKSFWRREIKNEATQAILEGVFEGKDLTITQTWTPEYKTSTNPFWALLGSPNGNGIIYFLTDNKKALKGKRIVSIKARGISSQESALGYYFTMWATFE
jgi:hypothetical protein